MVALLVYLLQFAGNWPWFVWVILSPVLYSVWLISFLFFCAPTIRRMGTRFPKPRRITLEAGGTQINLRTVVACSLRMRLILSLPLVGLLQQSTWGRNLVMLGYSPAIHFGQGVQLGGIITDPELTEIGDHAVVGLGSIIVAHMWTNLPNRTRGYTTAPVKIGARATIGASTFIICGCTIGDDAVIEPLSYLEPHTTVPPGEVWGGRPAVFIRKRRSISRPEDAAEVA